MSQQPISPSADLRHQPVMLDEVIVGLALRDGDLVVDATFGAGGYSRAILAAAATRVIGIDRDPDAVAGAYALVAQAQGRLTVVEDRFSRLDAVARSLGHDSVDAVVLDVGVSSMQLDEVARGFSFRQDGPLDMRMGKRGETAAELLYTRSEAELARIFRVFGEERRAAALARAVVADRQATPFRSTGAFAELCARVVRGHPGEIHPATRAFQALRIAVNGELDELAEALLAAERILRDGGRLVVVTFHSLEDRIVKTFLANRCRRKAGGSRFFPEPDVPPPTFAMPRRGALSPGAAEVAANPRARSAKLRSAVRTSAPAPSGGTGFLGLPDPSPSAGNKP